MSETKTGIERLVGETSGDVSYLVTEQHTIADIARWIIKEKYDDDILYFLNHRDDL